MEGKVLGIPVIIIVLALVIAALVDIPLVLLNVGTQADLIRLGAAQENTQTTVSQLIFSATPTPTATPSASPVFKVQSATKAATVVTRPTPIITPAQRR